MSTAAAAATPSDKQNLSPSQLNAVARRCPNLEELILQVINYCMLVHFFNFFLSAYLLYILDIL